MAQEAEHILGKDEVTGSNPVSSSNSIKSRLSGQRERRDFSVYIKSDLGVILE